GPVALFILVSFYSQLNQPVQQLRIGEAARLPKLGIHTDLGKAWQRIDLVDIDAPGLFLQKEIHASQTTEVKGHKRLHRLAAYLLRRSLGDIGGDNHLGFVIDVLGVIVIKFIACDHLASKRGYWLVIAPYTAFKLAAA